LSLVTQLSKRAAILSNQKTVSNIFFDLISCRLPLRTEPLCCRSSVSVRRHYREFESPDKQKNTKKYRAREKQTNIR
ncbi:hypothetical protein, partial [Photobacterium sp. 53610]|uniref:hypothetical protein n=1 Tax=Photobacterium sp. 53610 TaxID=3102789 RepID=UPI002ED7FBB1